MPGNKLKINDSKELSWYVGDSKMPNLIKYLNRVGTKDKIPCKKCGQVDNGQTGEYPCSECGLPTTHDNTSKR